MPNVAERADHSILKSTIAAGASGLGTSLDIRSYRSGSVRVPTGWLAADLSFLAAEDDPLAAINQAKTQPDPSQSVAPTYVVVRALAGSILLLVTPILTTGPAWYPLPADLFKHGFIKPKSTNTASEAAVNQTGAPILLFSLKS